ncbi:hypothetical protein [Salicibibacter kimchii]|uniref:Uncharacterized protein n=1 Tax=Salicibibacter kimchii TaxID=2099786 RepID=A0A345BX15_9BACI|nr:hypothetical protein [Salicibibacter kimchii]AXF55496.1 hypothetical protein DT065_05305 [Salicibibacter kimchii]
MKKKDRKLITGMLLTLAALLVGGFVIPVDVGAPSDTRTILDHSTQEYVSPSCIDEAEVTNYLQETNYGHALTLDYEPESGCSVDYYQESDVPLIVATLKTIGIVDQKWSAEDMLRNA